MKKLRNYIRSIVIFLISSTLLHANVWQESDGIIIIEAEDTESSTLGLWDLKTDSSAFAGTAPTSSTPQKHTGTGYLEYTGNNPALGPPGSPIEYSFTAQKDGLYQMYLRCAKENVVIGGVTRGDVANDCYIRMEGDFGEGPDAAGGAKTTGGVSNHTKNANETLLRNETKYFGGKHFEFEYATGSRLDPGGHDNKRKAIYHFKAGNTYKLIVFGRSKFFKLDRIILRFTGQGDPDGDGIYTNVGGAGSGAEATNINRVQSSTIAALSPNDGPIVDAGVDQTISLPRENVVINSSVSVAEGRSIQSYQWIKVSGPSVTLSGQATSSLTLTNLSYGRHIFHLKVTDSTGSSTIDEVRINAYSPTPSITGINLLDTSQSSIQTITNGSILNTNSLGGRLFNIQALTSVSGDFGKVRLQLTGPYEKNTFASGPAWKLLGNETQSFPNGDYTLVVTPYSQVISSESGIQGIQRTINFSVTDVPPTATSDPTVTGELKKWHCITFSWDGPNTNEKATTNPFTDYRLDVTFSHSGSGKTYVVPGFYAADGNAANTSATAGNVWRVRFSPDEIGTWNYSASFKTGEGAAINPTINTSAGFFDGNTGSFNIAGTDKMGRDHRGKGRLQYVGEHFLKFAETGEYFLKAGTDSPESLLAYEDFDEIPNHRNIRKNWSDHQSDYNASEGASYTWGGGKGTEILGAINYLVSEGLNSFSFLTCNIDGDGRNVFPYLLKKTVADYNAVPYTQQWAHPTDTVYHDRFDVSRLAQWEKVFAYGDYKGMHLHFKLMETENDHIWDSPDSTSQANIVNEIGPERKLYFRELVARFGHHLAMNWNFGEESTMPVSLRKTSLAYMKDIDPYGHHRVIHSHGGQGAQNGVYNPLLGNASGASGSELTGTSIQTNKNNFHYVHLSTKRWREASVANGKPWVVACDEPGDPRFAVIADHYVDYFLADTTRSQPILNAMTSTVDVIDPELGNSHMHARQSAIWGNVMAGGAGVEIYAGYFAMPGRPNEGDLTMQDLRSRDRFWDYCRYMLEFFKDNEIPFWEMKNIDSSPAPTDWEVAHLAKEGEAYVIFLKDERNHRGVNARTLDLSGYSGTYSVTWYNPRTGGSLQNGSVTTVEGGSTVSLGNCPVDESTIAMDLTHKGKDWVILVRRTSDEPVTTSGCLEFEALTHFTALNSGEVPYYNHNARNALAINAGIEANRNKFAKAQLSFTGDPGIYNISIRALKELDGECTYRLSVNDVVIGSFTNDRTNIDYLIQDHVFPNISIPAGAVIAVESNSVTNGLIAEGVGTAYARGRWTKLVMCPSVSTPVSGSYIGSPHQIPGSIEVEHFDYGNNNDSYSDTSIGNSGGINFRNNTDVDFVGAPGGGIAVGWIPKNNTEWWEYSVNSQAGNYGIVLNASNGRVDDAIVVVSLNDTELGRITVPYTGGWNTYRDFIIEDITVPAEVNRKLRLTKIPGGEVNLNVVSFEERIEGSFLGNPHTIPGLIEAEHYDYGENGVAYNDTSPDKQGLAEFRPYDEVDFVAAPSNGIGIGYSPPGEWWEYTVNSQNGVFNVELRAANGTLTDSSVSLSLNGSDLGSFTVSPTGGWGKYETFLIPNVAITSQQNAKLRLSVVSGGVNLDSINISNRNFRSWARRHIQDIDSSHRLYSFMGDYDNDGKVDSLEYVIGGDPTKRETGLERPGPRIRRKQMSTTLVKPLPDDVEICVEASPTLNGTDWTEVGLKPKNEVWSGEVDLIDEGDHYMLELTGDTTALKKFYRIVVSQ